MLGGCVRYINLDIFRSLFTVVYWLALYSQVSEFASLQLLTLHLRYCILFYSSLYIQLLTLHLSVIQSECSLHYLVVEFPFQVTPVNRFWCPGL
jgi:hypothetical protein